MSNFVTDGAAVLPNVKVDRWAMDDPSREVGAADLNALRQALLDIRDAMRRNVIYVDDYGAVGDGSTNNGDLFNDLMNEKAATVNGAYGATLVFSPGCYRTDKEFQVPNGIWLKGTGTGTILKPTGGYSRQTFIRNANTVGGQEYFGLMDLIIDAGGVTCSEAVVSMGSLFVNSGIFNVVINGGSAVGLHIVANAAMGPLIVDNTWVLHSGSHNIFVEEAVGNTGACCGIWLRHVTSENQGDNSSAIYLKGRGHSGQYNLHNIHIEQGGTQTGRTAITIENCSHVNVDGVQILAGTPANEISGITITNDPANVSIQIRNVYNLNGVKPVLQDLKNGNTIGSATPQNVPWYVTPDVNIQGGIRFTPSTSGVSAAFQNSAGADKVWFTAAGQLTGSSPNSAGLDILGAGGAGADSRVLTLGASVASGVTTVAGWQFPTGSGGAWRETIFSSGANVRQMSTDGSQFFYAALTLQALVTLQSGIAIGGGVIIKGSVSAQPSTGTHAVGEIYYNNTPTAGGFIGWVCVGAGSPGTWKTFGAISA